MPGITKGGCMNFTERFKMEQEEIEKLLQKVVKHQESTQKPDDVESKDEESNQ
jgi:hypothetical protein